jgi:hypothetical protein
LKDVLLSIYSKKDRILTPSGGDFQGIPRRGIRNFPKCPCRLFKTYNEMGGKFMYDFSLI